MMNGNFVFIHKNIFDIVGFIDKIYTHNYGDIDYGLSAIKKGFQVKVSSKLLEFAMLIKLKNGETRILTSLKGLKV